MRKSVFLLPVVFFAVNFCLASDKPIVILNEDNNQFFWREVWYNEAKPVTEKSAQAYVDQFLKGPVTHFFINPNCMTTLIDSKTYARQWEQHERKGCKCKAGEMLRVAKEAFLSGVDAYAIWIRRCREKGVSPWLTFRMNDVHNVNHPEKRCIVDEYWDNHPELRRCGRDFKVVYDNEAWERFTFDYAQKPVRERMLRFIAEMLERYDTDGIELDWMRWPQHLADGKEREGARYLTEFVREARRLADEAAKRRGHPVKVGVRVSATPEIAKAYGTDVDEWARLGYVDLVVPSTFWGTIDYDMPYSDWRSLIAAANPKVLVVPGCDLLVYRESGAFRQDVVSGAEYCGWLERHFAEGAPGVYVFNHFDIERDERNPFGQLLVRDGDFREAVVNSPRAYVVTSHDIAPRRELLGLQLPRMLDETVRLRLPVGTVPKAGSVALHLGAVGAFDEKLLSSVRLNGVAPSAKMAIPVLPWLKCLPKKKPVCTDAYRFEFPLTALRSGVNEIEVGVALGGGKVRLMACELFVTPDRERSAGDLVLAERGKSASCSIVIPANASLTLRYAAEELRDFVRRMTGVALAVDTDDKALPPSAILLGPTRYTAEVAGVDVGAELKRLGEEGFRLKVAGGHLAVIGSDSRGALYGVYELLETYGGVGWFASWHTLIPQLERFSVPSTLDDSQKPAFKLRNPLWYDVCYTPDFSARLRMNGSRLLEAKHGGCPYSFSRRFGVCHTFDQLVPPSKYFAKHPEYYSLVNGRRLGHCSQLCLTNPDVLAIVTSNILAAVRAEPEVTYFGVSQNDCLNFCTCPSCRAVDEEEGSHAGTMIRFVNAVAEAVEKEFPGKIIETLAYTYTRKPPKNTRVRHNVMPCLCVIECDYARPIPESVQADTKDMVDYFRSWSAQTDMLYVWDYTTNFRHYPHAMPNVYALQGNLKFFRDNKAVAVLAQGGYQGRHADFAELKAWLIAKWMWNPDLEMMPLIERFFKGYYGKAAPFVRTYFEELHALQSKSSRPLRIYDDPGDSCGDDAFFARAAELWRQAEEAVRTEDPVYRRNVRMGAFAVDYTRFARGTRPMDATLNGMSAAVPDPAGLARKILRVLEDEPKIKLSEKDADHNMFIRRIKATADGGAEHASGIAAAPATTLRVGRPEKAFVADVRSPYGRSLLLANTHHDWFARYHLNELAYDTNTAYRLRLRLRVERPADAPAGEVLWAGAYDTEAKLALCKDLAVPSSAVDADGWVWVETPAFVPNEKSYVWIAPGRFDRDKLKRNPAMTAAYIDRFEFVRAEKLP